MLETDATSLPRLMNCNGSRLMGGAIPPIGTTDNNPRDEGIAAHHMAYEASYGMVMLHGLIGQKAQNGVFMTEEMHDYVEMYLEAIASIYRGVSSGGGMEIETTFETASWRVNGRADNITETPDVLYVDDFKYGWGIVEPEMNWTLIAHAIGYCLNNNHQPSTIILTIHQPRPGHPDGKTRSWTINYTLLLELYHQIDATLSNPSDELNTGAHCTKCPALSVCPAARIASMNAIEASAMVHEDNLENAVLSFELDNLKRAQNALKSRFEALEELAKHRIMNGEIIENYAVDRGFGNTTWNKGVTVDMLKLMTGKDLSAGKLITPTKAMKAGVPEAIVKPLTHRPETGTKLKRVSADKKAQKIFS